MAPPLESVVRPPLPVDLRLTLGVHRRGRGDPTWAVDAAGGWWHARRTADGPATVRYGPVRGREVPVSGWGPGAERALAEAPLVLGCGDSLEDFAPTGLVRELHAALPGLRVGRTRQVFASLLPTVLEQKVISAEARRSYRRIVLALGEPAPGPVRLRLQPTPRRLAATPGWAFHPFGVELRRAGIVRYAASRAARVEEAADLPLPLAHRRLRALPGVGAWTAAEVALHALGDADAVSVGDFHLPHTVAWALAGEPRATDARMLELLEPYRGHRGRVIRLIEAAGLAPPRFGPRMPYANVARL